jgi:hypothetical protein
MFGWISNRAAISDSVASSFSAARVTFALNSDEYRFRFRLLVSSSFRQSNLHLIRLSEKRGPLLRSVKPLMKFSHPIPNSPGDNVDYVVNPFHQASSSWPCWLIFIGVIVRSIAAFAEMIHSLGDMGRSS